MTADHVVKNIPAVRLVAVRATLEPDRLGEHIGPMFGKVITALQRARGAFETPIATCAETEAGMDVVVGYENPGPPPDSTEMMYLPESWAVCGMHLAAGSGPGVAGKPGMPMRTRPTSPVWQVVADDLQGSGFQSVGFVDDQQLESRQCFANLGRTVGSLHRSATGLAWKMRAVDQVLLNSMRAAALHR